MAAGLVKYQNEKGSPKASPAGYCRCEEEGTMIMSKCTVYVYLKMIIER
jgi:hypothetical protein